MLTLARGIDIFEKLTLKIGRSIWKSPFAYSVFRGWKFDAEPVFFFNIFCGGLHFDALIIGFCYICLIIGQTFGEGARQKVFVGMSMEIWGISLAWEQVNRLEKSFA